MRIGKRLTAITATGLGICVGYLIATGNVSLQARAGAQSSAGAPRADLDRSILPIREPKIAVSTTLDARNAKAPPRFEVKAPAKAPNVLIVLIDDMGFGQSSAFGGPVHMPNLERMAKGGLRYNQF